MVLGARAPKRKSINDHNPCILHASAPGTRGKSALRGKRLFIFPLVGNQELCAKRNARSEDSNAQHNHNKGRELPRDVAPLPKSSN